MGIGRVRGEGEWVFVWWQAPLIVVILGPAFPGTYFQRCHCLVGTIAGWEEERKWRPDPQSIESQPYRAGVRGLIGWVALALHDKG
jgi:hypothetical protein